MPTPRTYIEPKEQLRGAELLIEHLEKIYPDKHFENRHDVILTAALALVGADGILRFLGQR